MGAEAIRATFSGLFDPTESVHWTTLDIGITGDKAYCEYRRLATLTSGEKQDFHSIDLLKFRNGRIVHKDTYYKARNPG